MYLTEFEPPKPLNAFQNLKLNDHDPKPSNASSTFGACGCLLSFGGLYVRAVFWLPIEIHYDEAENC